MVNFANGRQTGRDRAPEVFYQTFVRDAGGQGVRAWFRSQSDEERRLCARDGAPQELDRNSVVDEGRRRDALQRQHADLVLELELERKELDSVQNLVKVRCF